ncbi:tape measure protein [Crenobacter cavernae]|uniref:Tape measure protein N-terminal domain-containing protein n=1 Tax=Crenobacter cavernae TaxID=2290923 RepID=A0A345Y6R6_9NEIS|nr:tape measure protein [Crenobacter cavernae]AXK39618.1 hypothetical protein DWG20_09275 [Crenobacter cavernae]
MTAQARAQIEVGVVDKATARLRDINKAFAGLKANAYISRAAKGLKELGKEMGLGRVAESVGRVKDAVGDTVGVLGRYAAAGGVAAVVAGGIVGGMVNTASEFERFESVLETLEGTQAKAAKSMDWVSDFAAKTPYELAEVTDSFVKLRAYGIDPIKGDQLRTLGDTAAAMSKPVMQAVEAIADAVTGENERLKEFGIKASKVGKSFVYEYTDKNGKQRKAKAGSENRDQIRETLNSIWNEKYSGAMDRMSKTWSGMVSNLKDQWARFQMMVMKAGVFDWLKDKLQGFLAKVDTMAANGTLQAWAEDVGTRMKEAFVGIWEAGQQFAEFVVELKDMLGGWKNLMIAVGAVLAGPLLMALVSLTGAVWSLGVALYATPVGWAVAALAAIAAAAVALYMNWDKVVSWVGDLLGVFRGDWGATFDALKTLFLNFTPLGWMIQAIAPLSPYLQAAWDWIKGVFAAGFELLKFAFLNFTPLGWMIQALEPLKAYVGQVFDWIADKLSWMRDAASAIGNAISSSDGGPSAGRYGVPTRQSAAPPARPSALPAGGGSQVVTKDAAVKVVFENMPSGAKAVPVKNDGVKLTVQQGYYSPTSS